MKFSKKGNKFGGSGGGKTDKKGFRNNKNGKSFNGNSKLSVSFKSKGKGNISSSSNNNNKSKTSQHLKKGFNNNNHRFQSGGNKFGKPATPPTKTKFKSKFGERKYSKNKNDEIKDEFEIKNEDENEHYFGTVGNFGGINSNGKINREVKEEESDDDEEIAAMGFTEGPVPKKGKHKKKSGGFQGMGLSPLVIKGVIRRGYNVPTPIQRKAIPPILEGRDVVAMARTGSGKTAAFLIPMFEKLQARRVSIGTTTKFPRALILSPTRELALQTAKFIKEIGRFLDFKVACILGGESMERQFQTLHDKPDVVVATPGRFMHLCVEMELKLDGVEYAVFDEADRLFEMGFGEQLMEILKRLPESRQTVLFSATLPKLLVDFSKAGLHDPTLIRLDVDTKLPEQLDLKYLACRSEDKLAVLMYLLKNIIDERQQTIVFTATKHHVEFIHQFLDEANINNCYIYSSLDPDARKNSLAKFRSGRCNVMIVTDIAARGIDIPILDNVINFHFPAKPKLFMHRVGRVARAGRSGTAYSILTPDEIAFLLDLHMFLDRQLLFQLPTDSTEESKSVGFVGRVPQDLVNDENNFIRGILDVKLDLATMSKVSRNGYAQYLKSRPNASTESNRRAKGIEISKLSIHPIFAEHIEADPMDSLITQMQSYRPNATIFEIGPKSGSETQRIMKLKRVKDQNTVEKHRTKLATNNLNVETLTEKVKGKEEDHFVPYLPKDHHTELGLSVGTTFDKQVQEAEMDLTGDDSDLLKQQRSMKKWDQKKKKFVSMGKDTNAKKIKTESGVWISASYKSDRYKSWMQKSKIEHQNHDEDNEGSDDDSFVRNGSNASNRNAAFSRKLTKVGKNETPNAGKKGKRFKSEIKRPEQILKQRKLKEKKLMKNMPKPMRKQRQKDGGGGKRSFGKKRK